MNRKYVKRDWKAIQKEYDKGCSTRDLVKLFGLSKSTIEYARQRGDFKGRTKSEGTKLKWSTNPRKLSDETKNKISKSRIKYLNDHPDQVPYRLNHSSKMSYPEKIFKKLLEENGITGWTYNYQNSIYSYDFAFPELKIDVEIDGSTHLTEKVKLIDKRRDQFSIENGWTVLRFSAIEIKNSLNDCIEKLKNIIHLRS